MLLRSVLSFAVAMGALSATAQVIDSVRIFKAIPQAGYTTSLAETAAWKLHRSGAAYVSIGASDLQGLNEQLEKSHPARHAHALLPQLTHLGFVYMDRAAHVFCLADEEGLIIDLTARRQFRLEDWTDRVKLRAALVALGL